MKKGVVFLFALLCMLPRVCVADVGSDMPSDISLLQKKIAVLEKQNDEVAELKDMVSKLIERVTTLEKKNTSTEKYARSLETQLKAVSVPAPQRGVGAGAPTVPAIQTRCASTSCHTFLSDMGNIQMGLAATGVIGHVESAEGSENDVASGSFNIYMESPISSNAVFHLNLEGIGGNWDVGRTTLTGLNADSGSLQDSDGVDRLQVREAKVQAAFWDDMLTAYAGKVDPTAYFDGNEGANDETSQFLAAALVNNETFTGTFPGGYVPGVGAYYNLGNYLPGIVVGSGLFSRDNSANHIFDNLMWITEVDYATELAGLPGNYRVYAYLAGQEGMPGGNDNNGIDDDLGIGFGISVDQKITESILLFGRFGYNGNDVAAGDTRTNAIANDSLSFGVQVENPLIATGFDRPGDVFGLGYAQHALFDDPTNGDGVGADHEQLVEAFYRYQINGQVSLSPFYQFTRQAGGDAKGDRIHIMGVRSSVEF